jgi:hypothetical protein
MVSLWIMLQLPKKYLSYSQYKLWKDNKEQYRQRYYHNGPSFESVETIFGKDFAERLERGDPSVAYVPHFEKSEHPIKVELKGIPLLGYIDSYCPTTHAFKEFKTGHQPWDAVRVAKHEQLDFYSLLIEMADGEVTNECELIWLQTKKVPKCILFDGIEICSDTYNIELTGEMKQFKRTIYKYERERMKKEIQHVAESIAEDYASSMVGAV